MDMLVVMVGVVSASSSIHHGSILVFIPFVGPLTMKSSR